MKHFIFSNTQKETLQCFFKDVQYSPFKSHFQFIEIIGNRWILPETVKDSEDIMSRITEDIKPVIDEIISSIECREINEEEKLGRE